ncbi:KAP family P-loop domain protein [Pseudarthrobacter phenanthrenivorans Sphe3]|uniref:KAP family P-loop domain protein n=1 Tax=Pseudarthrobacter phenanthrenivorans (strain DSM 18606 / JCM 16027 / LMG 23796 / Sphe3) TaxID=930171 RepID=F0M3I3_PSEPM|nr:KAP family P-loop domain-containing protein [Pseudarthrobacter phenanthrenivorans]ADX72202.1 KAP family P-loop domain protein [Pseudarthrobacter phenanthrenivorans Sphe3]
MIAPYSDAPGSSRTDDRLNRGSFVQAVIDLLAAVSDGNDSTIVSLEGPWGSGKTQILNEIQPALRKQSIRVVNFTPWAAEDAAGLQAEFHAALRGAFAGLSKFSPTKVKSTGNKLAIKSIPLLGVIPIVGESLRDTAEGLLEDESWESTFQQYAAEIKKAGVKIVVIVDDLDRLSPNELLHVLKTIRLLGRLPRVNYLLAFDPSALQKTLSVVLGGDTNDASSFLEKIVQYPLAVPPAQEIHLRSILREGLVGLLNSTQADVIWQSESRFWQFYESFMRTRVQTVRSVKRYSAQAQVYMKLLHQEVDSSDFLALTFIRLEHHRVYQELRFWKNDLLHHARHTKRQQPLDWDGRLEDLGYTSKEERSFIVNMLSSIFPTIASSTMSANPNPAKASNPDYFDRYFVFSVPATDVPDASVEKDLNRVTVSKYPENEIFPVTFDNPLDNLAQLAIRKAIPRSEARESIHEHERIVKYVLISMGRSSPRTDGEGQYSPRLFAQTEWLKSSLKRQTKAISIEDWKSLIDQSDVVAVARVIRDIVDEFQGDSIPDDLRVPVPSHIDALRVATMEVLLAKLRNLISSSSYDGLSRQFFELFGSLSWLRDEGTNAEIDPNILASGNSLPHIAGWFVQPGRSEGNLFLFDEAGSDLSSLNLDGLVTLVGIEVVKQADIDLEPGPSASEQTRARERQAVQSLKKWRESLHDQP